MSLNLCICIAWFYKTAWNQVDYSCDEIEVNLSTRPVNDVVVEAALPSISVCFV